MPHASAIQPLLRIDEYPDLMADGCVSEVLSAGSPRVASIHNRKQPPVQGQATDCFIPKELYHEPSIPPTSALRAALLRPQERRATSGA